MLNFTAEENDIFVLKRAMMPQLFYEICLGKKESLRSNLNLYLVVVARAHIKKGTLWKMKMRDCNVKDSYGERQRESDREESHRAITANFHKNQFCQEIFMQSGFTSRCEGNLFMEQRAALIRGVSPNGFIPLSLPATRRKNFVQKLGDEMLLSRHSH